MGVYLVKLLLLVSLLFISCDHKAEAFVHHSGSTVRSTTGQAKYSHRRIAYYSNSQSTFQLQLLISGDIELNPGPSSQGNEDPKNSHLKCILLNSRSIVNTTLDLQAELAIHHIDIACVKHGFAPTLLTVKSSMFHSTIYSGETETGMVAVYYSPVNQVSWQPEEQNSNHPQTYKPISDNVNSSGCKSVSRRIKASCFSAPVTGHLLQLRDLMRHYLSPLTEFFLIPASLKPSFFSGTSTLQYPAQYPWMKTALGHSTAIPQT